MLARCLIGLFLLQGAVFGFGGFDFTSDDGTVYHVDEVTDEERTELEANGCDVDCAETCWYLADGDVFKSCVDFCGCEELIEEKEASAPESLPSQEERRKRSGPPKDPDDEIVLRTKQSSTTHSQMHKAWKTQISAQTPVHKAWKSTLIASQPLRSSNPEEPEAEATTAYGDCSGDCSQVCRDSTDSCLEKCKASFCVSRGWNLSEYLGTAVFLGTGVVAVFYGISGLKTKKQTYLLEDSAHRH